MGQQYKCFPPPVILGTYLYLSLFFSIPFIFLYIQNKMFLCINTWSQLGRYGKKLFLQHCNKRLSLIYIQEGSFDSIFIIYFLQLCNLWWSARKTNPIPTKLGRQKIREHYLELYQFPSFREKGESTSNFSFWWNSANIPWLAGLCQALCSVLGKKL